MNEALLETLPVAHRLALAYAPRDAREATLAVLALDARLAKIVRQRGERLIAQMKLAWWRDRFAQPPVEWPKGEPVLELLHAANVSPSHLSSAVDGWEILLAEELDAEAARGFAQGRAGLWHALTADEPEVVGAITTAAREWALVDLALNLGHEDDRAAVMALAKEEAWARPALPKRLRPLAVLHALARRSMRAGSRDLLDGPGAMMTTLRVGILGR
ncbi:squalene/phytoene synthase family protein [Aurantiacibacter gangjinensis]|uniref:Uncharacterized protein n=1 Tax=Aurantiacibacter gangjinensis TaxID=502682 RepID=A0A0G9MQC5_9SPHN|nr:squalene/phytoene synthase family protein [Aurantiacibacter gangjinensis]APE28784.1 hypothetical protein BMF35_a1955 [Aurantiacibacter gangjinensis]KLE32936.1 hypothetical protein AAW01_02670 [Aurantiacibacter gangjinensis]